MPANASTVRPFKIGFPEADLTDLFPDELYQAPHGWAKQAYPKNLIHYNRLNRGGHFAAWEQPQLFSGEMRSSFRSLR